MRTFSLLTLATVALAASAPANAAPDSYRFGKQGEVTLYRPQGPVKGVALFLSGDGGWNLGVVDMAKQLTTLGIAVAGFSTPAYMKAWEGAKDACINPNFDMVAFAQDVEHRLKLPNYVEPVLVGYSSGATVAYATLAQAPKGLYRGAVSLGFGPDMPGQKPWCAKGTLTATRITTPEHGWLFAPAALPAPWVVLQGLSDQVVSPAVTRAFAAKVPQAKLVELPKVGHGFSVPANWMPQFEDAVRPLVNAPQQQARAARPVGGPALPEDLPLDLVTAPGARRTDLMAIMVSGDGGWAGLDRDVAASFARAGVPVVGLNALKYFWNARTPAATAQDLSRIVEGYGAAWGRPKVLLVGYSFGAGVLPAAVRALPPAVRARVAQVSLMGLPARGDFEFRLEDWLDIDGSMSRPTVPDIVAINGVRIQCLRGMEEADSACPAIPVGEAQQIVMPGGHHFDGNADGLVQAMLRPLGLGAVLAAG